MISHCPSHRSTLGSAPLILITIDCLRADHVGFMGYRRPITPTLDGVAQQALWFRRALVAGLPTFNSFPALLAGRYALGLGRDLVGLAPEEDTLASVLRAHGYRTSALVAGNPYLSRWMGYHQGFDDFDDFLDNASRQASSQAHSNHGAGWFPRLNRALLRFAERHKVLSQIYHELYFWYGLRQVARRNNHRYADLLVRFPRAETITDRAIEHLQRAEHRQQPFFMWLHYMDAHRPYFPSASALAALGRQDLTPQRMFALWNRWLRRDLSAQQLARYVVDFVDLYDASIATIDAQLARLFDFIKQSPRLQHALVAVTSDHGEVFLERGERDHDPVLVTQELVHVPLLLFSPASTLRGEVNAPFSLIDLAPTLLDGLGVNAPASFVGKSRWHQLRPGESWDDPAVTDIAFGYTENPKGQTMPITERLMAVQDDRYKLVFNFHSGQLNLFDLKQDPREKSAMEARAVPQVSAALLARLRAHLVQHREQRYSKAEVLLRSHVTRERLNVAMPTGMGESGGQFSSNGRT